MHHLWFEESRYEELGSRIKCNPAIKRSEDRDALIKALNEGRIDIIATDHAPHTAEEKNGTYFQAPAGLPLVQHALLTLFDLVGTGRSAWSCSSTRRATRRLIFSELKSAATFARAGSRISSSSTAVRHTG